VIKLTHISLFSGIGGIDIAAEWAGFETILFIEKDEYCQKVLRKHWPSVPIIGDIRDVKKENVADSCGTRGARESTSKINRCSGNSGRESTKILQLQRERTENNQPITLITGGIPCQPFSVAGKRRGKDDDRFLWPEMLRVIKEFKPTWVCCENVLGIINMALDTVCSDLEAEGYETQTIVLPACGVNAPHRRYRVFIVAYSTGGRQQQHGWPEQDETAHSRDEKKFELCSDVPDSDLERQQQPKGNITNVRRRISNSGEDVADTEGQGLERTDTEGDTRSRGWITEHGQREWESDRGELESSVRRVADGFSEGLHGNWWDSEWEGVPRVATGVKHRVDRLRCLGNAVVPQQIYPILKAIAEIELKVSK